MCEWDVWAIVSYAAIHKPSEFRRLAKSFAKLDSLELSRKLAGKTFSKDSKKSTDISRMPHSFQALLAAACAATDNRSDISLITAHDIGECDVLTYSFPCQGLSIANMGRGKGIGKKAESTSSLIWHIARLLRETKDAGLNLPRYLLMENVKELLNSKNMPHFKRFMKELSGLGYETQWATCNSLSHGSIQSRKRVYALSVLSSNGFDFSLRFDEVGKEAQLAPRRNRKESYVGFLKASDRFPDEIEAATPNWTPSRIRMFDQNDRLSLQAAQLRKPPWTVRTLTCKQDRNPNLGMIPIDGGRGRFITPRQAFILMGFSSADFSRVKSAGTFASNEVLYRQAGNSISVEVLENIFCYIREIEMARRGLQSEHCSRPISGNLFTVGGAVNA